MSKRIQLATDATHEIESTGYTIATRHLVDGNTGERQFSRWRTENCKEPRREHSRGREKEQRNGKELRSAAIVQNT